uniref:NADH-ubiquinone oxidoreductase chain 6 n=1 Tax=Indri indri TaxID=34827 RepID=A0A0A7DD71_INDIN|nr:NADH dehydrogenase subunit 6 [Indri indri]AII98182.1 NADH dehydrogenase subunit 6 [Indri indri]AII98233.1 NADH dehydrogenase subunit 6 [Indri indri]AII98272.1 NADH dehydrogenase subunit 6 [Indri indri]AII98467.1 NADH dehydrogenase subunit 6 [Indri indri]AII98492.1 NADH dehydrogenase subunit 6 [Indri indri]
MAYAVFLLSVVFVLGFMSFSSKPSPIYGGVGLIVSGAVGCGIIMNFGGSFVGLVVFLIYLGGMLVVFGYTTAMATEEYPETWGSSVVIWGVLMVGFVMELFMVVWVFGYGGLGEEVSLASLESWVVFVDKEAGVVRDDSSGVTALYNQTSWFIMIAAWSLFVSVLIVVEMIRG